MRTAKAAAAPCFMRADERTIVEVGFAALRAHTIIPIDECPVLAPELDGAIKAAWAIAGALALEQKPLDIQVTATTTGLDIDVRGSGPLDQNHRAKLARLVGASRVARVTRHGELVAQTMQPIVVMGRAKVAIPPGSFLQATETGEDVLARLRNET